jgi:hypothetical protein
MIVTVTILISPPIIYNLKSNHKIMFEQKQLPDPLDLQEVKEAHLGIEKVRLVRTLSHKRTLARKGHIIYRVSFIKKGIKYEAGPQVSLAWEAEVGEEAVKKHLREQYVK